MRVGAPVADYVGALQAVVGVTAALVERTKSGLGQKVDIRLLDGQIGMLSNYLPGFGVTGEPSGPVGAYHPQLAPYQPFDTKDGTLIVACLTEEFWRSLCTALDLPELIDDPRFRTNSDRVHNRSELERILAPVIRATSTAALSIALESADVPFAPIHSIEDLLQHPQVRENGTIIELEHSLAGKYRAVAAPFSFERTPGGVSTSAPELGFHSREVLIQFGFTNEEVSNLVDKGIVH